MPDEARKRLYLQNVTNEVRLSKLQVTKLVGCALVRVTDAFSDTRSFILLAARPPTVRGAENENGLRCVLLGHNYRASSGIPNLA